MLKNRFVIKIGGESGQGIDSSGRILAESIKNAGYKVFGYREYPSIIKGGYACYQIDIADQEINSSSVNSDILVCLSRLSINKYLFDLNKGGILIHHIDELDFTPEELGFIKTQKIQVIYINTLEILRTLEASRILANIILLGSLWQTLGIATVFLEESIKREFADKPKLLKLDLIALQEGAKSLQGVEIDHCFSELKAEKAWTSSFLTDGNESFAKGAVLSGARAFYGYPMTPSTSILLYLADWQKDTGMIVKQVEDEITAAQMTVGSSFAGLRAFTATSGGGFDLMTETVSLTGMTEVPFVCIVGQRPGPSTGMPTWTAQGDLNLALYAGHGEFPRIVLAASDAVSAYRVIQRAFNLADKYQVPVIVLTEKQIAESIFNVMSYPKPLNIERNIVTGKALNKLVSTDRYKTTISGVSPRWVPGQSEATYVGNSDEHSDDGSTEEEADAAQKMFSKRMLKLKSITQELAEPKVFGPLKADISFVGWGSTKNVMLDILNYVDRLKIRRTINYLHFEEIFPVKEEVFREFVKKNNRMILVENNYLGQLGGLLKQHTGYDFKEKLLKYNGRPFFVEDILNFLKIK
jgi:2-oxoglutarate/2-oxoacid ferredoxin oxidoreductase subunit alpha